MDADAAWAAVFDVDGTMVDNRSYHEAAWLEMGRRRGLPITPAFYRARMHSRSNTDIARMLLGADVTAAATKRMSDEKEASWRKVVRKSSPVDRGPRISFFRGQSLDDQPAGNRLMDQDGISAVHEHDEDAGPTSRRRRRFPARLTCPVGDIENQAPIRLR